MIEPFLFMGGTGIAALLMVLLAEFLTRRTAKKVKSEMDWDKKRIEEIEVLIELALNSKSVLEFNIFKEAAIATAREINPYLLLIYKLFPYDIEEKLKDWSWIH